MADILNDHGTSLEAFWELEEASGTRADSFASFDLTDNNTVGQATGIQGNAASFNGANDESLSRSSASELNITASNDKTILFWVKGTGSDTYAYLFHRWGLGGVKNYLIRAVSSTGVIEFYLDNGGGGTGENATGTTDVLDDAWHMVCCTFTGSDNKARIYIDGNATPEDTSAAETPAGGSAPLYMGNTTGGNGLTGEMDEVGIWNRVLSTTEMSDIYNSGSGIPYDTGGASTASSAKRIIMMG